MNVEAFEECESSDEDGSLYDSEGDGIAGKRGQDAASKRRKSRESKVRLKPQMLLLVHAALSFFSLKASPPETICSVRKSAKTVGQSQRRSGGR